MMIYYARAQKPESESVTTDHATDAVGVHRIRLGGAMDTGLTEAHGTPAMLHAGAGSIAPVIDVTLLTPQP
jgi:hypothetical protein